jgi:hypothetical protein
LQLAIRKEYKFEASSQPYCFIELNHFSGVMLEVNCETDFVAAGDAFNQLVGSIAMQIVASQTVSRVCVCVCVCVWCGWWVYACMCWTVSTHSHVNCPSWTLSRVCVAMGKCTLACAGLCRLIALQSVPFHRGTLSVRVPLQGKGGAECECLCV